MRILNGLLSWTVSLMAVIPILFIFFLCTFILEEPVIPDESTVSGGPEVFLSIWSFAWLPALLYALRLWISHVELKERHPLHLIVERLIFCMPGAILAIFFFSSGSPLPASLSFWEWTTLLSVTLYFAVLPCVMLIRTVFQALRGEIGGEEPRETNSSPLLILKWP